MSAKPNHFGGPDERHSRNPMLPAGFQKLNDVREPPVRGSAASACPLTLPPDLVSVPLRSPGLAGRTMSTR